MTETELAPTGGDGRGPGGCPVVNVDIGLSGPILSHFEQWDELREQYPAFWTELYGGYWVVTRFDAIRHALQEPATFSNASTIVSDPNPEYTFIPTFLDPPEHGKYRTLYNARFSPGMVTRVTPAAREAANRYIDAFIDDGGCEFMTRVRRPVPRRRVPQRRQPPRRRHAEVRALGARGVRWAQRPGAGVRSRRPGRDARVLQGDVRPAARARPRIPRSTSSRTCCRPRSTVSRSPRPTC